MNRYAATPLGIFGLISNSLANYWSTLKQIWQIALAASLVTFVIQSAIDIKNNLAVGISLLAVGILFLILLKGALFIAADAVMQGREEKLSLAFNRAKHNYLTIAGTLLLAGLLIAACGALVAGIGFLLMKFFAQKQIFILVALLGICICSMLWVYFIFAVPLVVLSNFSVKQSLKTSLKLVKGHWWHVFWVYCLTALFFTMINIVIYSLTALLLTLANIPFSAAIMPDLGALPMVSIIIINIVRVGTSMLMTSAVVTVTLVVLNDLKLRQPAAPRANN